MERRFLELSDLRAAAALISLVRWLKENGIAADLDWAQRHPVKEVPTPVTVTMPRVVPVADGGKPVFRTRAENK